VSAPRRGETYTQDIDCGEGSRPRTDVPASPLRDVGLKDATPGPSESSSNRAANIEAFLDVIAERWTSAKRSSSWQTE